jgi:hypothetical protein
MALSAVDNTDPGATYLGVKKRVEDFASWDCRMGVVVLLLQDADVKVHDFVVQPDAIPQTCNLLARHKLVVGCDNYLVLGMTATVKDAVGLIQQGTAGQQHVMAHWAAAPYLGFFLSRQNIAHGNLVLLSHKRLVKKPRGNNKKRDCTSTAAPHHTFVLLRQSTG